MPRWDDPRGPHHDPERDRWRRDEMRDRGWSSDADARRRDPGRFGGRGDDPDRTAYGQRHEDAGEAGYAHRQDEPPPSDAYGDPGGLPFDPNDYSQESEGGFGGGASPGPDWGLDRDGERRRNFDFDDPGVGQSQAGYGHRTQTHPDQDFDPDYLRWRDAQLRSHDRDYQAWRRDQHRRYDEDYRRFRSERQRHFGEAFHEWRSQRGGAGWAPDSGAAPGVGGYGERTSGGYAAGAYDRPSGRFDPPSHPSADPTLRQRAGPSEFGREPRPVQATSEGHAQGHGEAHHDDNRRH